MSLDAKTGAAPPDRYPVAKLAPKAPKIRDAGEPEKADLVEDLLSPPSITGFAWSIAGHAIFLLILAFWYFSPPAKPAVVFDTRMAGSAFGDPSSDQLTGGLGMDAPLSLPEPAGPLVRNETPSYTITSLPASEIKPPVAAPDRPKTTGGSAGGVNLNSGQAGNGDGFGVAKFGHGGESINGVEVKVGDPQFTLIWDSRADIDLHVVEPGGSEIYWENRNGGQGGELDVDDVDGFGPENINYGQGRGAPGSYRFFVHYYGGLGGLAQNTRWKVRIKHAGKIDLKQGKFSAIGQKSQIFELRVSSDDGKAAPSAMERPSGDSVAAPTRSPADRPAPEATPAGAPGPKRLAPPGAGFSVVMADEPKSGREDISTPLGPAVAQTYTLERAEGALSLAFVEFPATLVAAIEPSKLLDGMVDQALSAAKGKLTRRGQVAQDGAAGREFEYTLPDSVVAGGGEGRGRVYLSGKTLYLLSIVGTKDFVASPEAGAYFKSLKISGAR